MFLAGEDHGAKMFALQNERKGLNAIIKATRMYSLDIRKLAAESKEPFLCSLHYKQAVGVAKMAQDENRQRVTERLQDLSEELYQ